MMNKIRDIFLKVNKPRSQLLFPLENSSLKVYFGRSENNKYMLSILSSQPSVNLQSTKILKIRQYEENETTYWLYFELCNDNAAEVFYSFCFDIVKSFEDELDEDIALKNLADRYYYWRLMFKNENHASLEEYKGLFGELYFLKNYMIPKYGVEQSIMSWVGSEKAKKDFSIENTWYEVKNVSINSETVHISSIGQLSSDTEGHLAIIYCEKMSPEFENENSKVVNLFNGILNLINNATFKDIFIQKVAEYNFDIGEASQVYSFSVHDINMYKVDKNFPRLTEKDIKFNNITNVKYEIVLGTFEEFKE